MNRNKNAVKLAAALVGAILLASCSGNAAVPADTAAATTAPASTESATAASGVQTAAAAVSAVAYDADDEYTDWESGNPNYIELNGDSASVTGTGAAVVGSQIKIAMPGVYVVSGKLDDGQILVELEREGTVRLVLNGAEIRSSDNAPIYVKQAYKTVISLAEGTDNVVEDGESYANANADEDEPNAAIFSKDDLTINGTGALTVYGNYNNGMMSKDELVITGGAITVRAADDGIAGRDMVAVKDGTITVSAGGDGIKTTNDTDAEKGYIVLEGGSYAIEAGADGMQAQTSLAIAGGQYTITTGGGSGSGVSDSQSAKGLKAAAAIAVSGGTIDIDSADDAVHSNGSLTLSGGQLSIASGDDGMHADASITISGGRTAISQSYEGVESALITITGGDTRVKASDDGINIGGGNDGSSVGGRPGQNSFSADGNNALRIEGGFVAVDSDGDGLDSNGSIAMTGGTVIVNGPTASNNGAIDYDGTFEISGGLLIAAGSAGMSQAPSEQSAQHSVMMQYSSVQQAGKLVHLQDGNGKTIATFAPSKPYETVVISSPDLLDGATYTLYAGGASTGSESEGLYSEGEYEQGDPIVSVTVADPVTYMNQSGVTSAPAGGRGGGMRGGR
ncbi:carbohydrate-binding domain-containing protein [Paenibacillus arenilitoris]|uniref:Carbohydrate-binding domain-containing protein n=1 Tax=Paenibacillus arenilitoris TaxID=2772299 RepID=A0A927CP01_9BACL|nr:carbohydrate-binding domain-containing protein [Paenibacillus arenilitoris]MBD2870822.1 carbohydrate-binding domain-containing protein [Paenibacillus arenilitoris]